MSRRLCLAIVSLLSLTGAGLADESVATARAVHAASFVDADEYEYVHKNLLYTHDGDDKLFGPEHDLCRDAIRARFQSYGLPAALEEFDAYGGWLYGYNVVAELTGDTRPSEIYVVSGHYDTITLEFEGCPGADDDASGVSAVLELARCCAQWGSAATIRFIAFDKEEWGLFGSAAHVEGHPGEDFRGMVSLDCFGWRSTPAAQVWVVGRTSSSSVKLPLRDTLATCGALLPVDIGRNDWSDHVPFEEAGFSAANVIEADVWDNPALHSLDDSRDRFGYFDDEYAVAVTRGALGWLVMAAGVHVPHPAGDLNGDYRTDHADVNPFVLALSNPAGYAAQYPDADLLAGDFNGDGVVGFADINRFLAALPACDGPQVAGRFQPPDVQTLDFFGSAVALAGTTALVGAPQDWVAGTGAVYAYEFADQTWHAGPKLVPDDAEPLDAFGCALALQGDDALIGAYNDDGTGTVRRYARAAGSWSPVEVLRAADAAPGDRFGQALALAPDIAVVGAPGSDRAADAAGAAYLFTPATPAWVQSALLLPAPAGENDQFGSAVAAGGGCVLVGARGDDEAGPDAGAAYLYELQDGAWQLAAKLLAPTGHPVGFGAAVAAGAERVVIGASQNNGYTPGLVNAYVYERAGAAWQLAAELGPWPASYNISVAIDGELVLVGRDGGNLPGGSGAVYLYEAEDGGWVQRAVFRSGDTPTDVQFGVPVALAGELALGGAVYEGWPQNAAGAVYDIRLAGGSGEPWITRQPENLTVHEDDPAVLSVAATGGPLRYQWRKDGVPLPDSPNVFGTTSAVLRVVQSSAADAGVYDVHIASPCGAVWSAAVQLTVTRYNRAQ